jgi:phosphate starvation-inducible PhoH-like protein
MNSLLKLSYLFLFVSKKIIKNNYSKSILLNVRNKNINFNDKDDDDNDTYIKYTKICKKKNVNSDQYMKNSNLKSVKKNLYVPKTYNQKEYVKALNNNDIDLLFCTGPAGTGKTLFACSYAIEQLNKNYINKFIITRPTTTIDENIGFLPGDINKKMSPFTQHIYDIFLEYYTQKEINSLIDNKIIEVVPLAFMQGRTFKNSIIIGDEMQNSTPNQMFMLTTRIGVDSKMIITGDPTQTVNKNNGLKNIIDKLNYRYNNEDFEDDKIKIIEMEYLDIQRHHIVKIINELYAGMK